MPLNSFYIYDSLGTDFADPVIAAVPGLILSRFCPTIVAAKEELATMSKIFTRFAAADLLEASKSEILNKWEHRARAEVEAAKHQSSLALRDSLPEFLDELVKTLKSDKPENKVQSRAEIAREHAEDRATQPEYTLDQVIVEYHLLRAIIISVVDAEGMADSESRKIIHTFIDMSISKAAIRYVEVESSLRTAQTKIIEDTKAAAERASQAKSAFLANMSHEIRTPLGAIMGFVGLIKESKIEQDEDVSSFLSIIERNSHHLLRIVDDILDLTKVEAGKIVIENMEFPLIEFLADFASLSGMKARENGISFEFKSPEKLPEFIISDPTRIRQILSNVVGNAIKFTEKGKVELQVTYREGQIEFLVSDTGRGISADQISSLFQAFAQADSSTTRKFGGTGLGLILTKKLSQVMGGDFVLMESELGKGSVFKTIFPVLLPDHVNFVPFGDFKEDGLVAPLTEEVTNLQGLKILLVEDSPDNQFLIQKMLARTQASIITANNGSEGLRMALDGDFDVVLMDIQMPIMDGHQAIRALRAKNYRAPVVALTAHAMKEENDRALQSGFSHFLTKPINRKNLIDLLAQISQSSILAK